ncbi:hypothetical protein B0J14DRAFT_23425 [Halenospora varia]|nr:hypothetical protein B0J14DRAFT_23425 [Halenospora varia]
MLMLGFRATAPAPSMLVTCKKSFQIASKHYRKSFRWWTMGFKPEVYFDYKRDTLYLRHNTIGYHGTGILHLLGVADMAMEESDIDRVENLAFLFDEDASVENTSGLFNDVPRIHLDRYHPSLLEPFPVVKKLTVVLKHYHSPCEAPGQEFDTAQSTLIPLLDLDRAIAVQGVFLESEDGYTPLDSDNFEVSMAYPWAEVDMEMLRERWNLGKTWKFSIRLWLRRYVGGNLMSWVLSAGKRSGG